MNTILLLVVDGVTAAAMATVGTWAVAREMVAAAREDAAEMRRQRDGALAALRGDRVVHTSEWLSAGAVAAAAVAGPPETPVVVYRAGLASRLLDVLVAAAARLGGWAAGVRPLLVTVDAGYGVGDTAETEQWLADLTGDLPAVPADDPDATVELLLVMDILAADTAVQVPVDEPAPIWSEIEAQLYADLAALRQLVSA